MIHSFRVAVACLAVLCCTPVRAEEPVSVLRVLTYNIHHGEGIDGKIDLPRIARVIRESKPDIVALQEVDQNVKRSGNVDQAAELAKLANLEHHFFCQSIELQGGGYGNALLCRYPATHIADVDLPRVGGGEQRTSLVVRIKLPGDTGKVTCLATHFDHRNDDAERLKSVGLLNEMFAISSTPTFLAGDLNAGPESKAITALKEAWITGTVETLPTFPADKPRQQIDYVWLNKGTGWVVKDAKVLEESVASDHRPLLVTWERAENPSGPVPRGN